MLKVASILLLLTAPALAQQEFVPPDQELWTQMSQAFSQISMPLSAHQQVQQIMQSVEQQARAKKAKEVKPNAK